MKLSGSPTGRLSNYDVRQALWTGLFVFLAAGCAAAAQWATGQDLGDWGVLAAMLLGFLADLFRRWASETQVVQLKPLRDSSKSGDAVYWTQGGRRRWGVLKRWSGEHAIMDDGQHEHSVLVHEELHG